MNKKNHIIIAGGGISGLATAICLAKRGYDVEVHEKRKEIGGRFKGDLQGLENWTSSQDVMDEIEEMGLGIHLIHTPLPALDLLVNGKDIIPIHTNKALSYLVKRGTDFDSLDQILYRKALDLNVMVRLESKIDPSKADIIATGPNSKKIFACDLGIKFITNHPDIAVAVVDEKAAYKGYAYLLICNGYGCLCTVLFNEFHRLRKQFEFAKNRILKFYSIEMKHVKEVGGVGSFATNDHHRLNKIHVGEAAGIQDFLFGFGIRSALRSGVLAAQCWDQQLDYSIESKNLFLSFQKAGLVNRFLYEKVGSFYGGYEWMSKWVRKNNNPDKFLQKAYQYTPIHKFLYPLAKSSIKNRYSGII